MMSCGCGCNGLNGLARTYGLRGLGDVEVPAGATFFNGFELGNSHSSYDMATVQNDLEGCLYGTGGFDNVFIDINQSWLGHDYITIGGTVTSGFALRADLSGLIRGMIRECAPNLAITRDDGLKLSYVPGGQVPTDGGSGGQYRCPDGTVWYESWFSKGCVPAQQNQTNNPDAPKVDCWKTTTSWNDYLACEMGITKTSAMMVGVVGALLAVVFIGKVAK